MDENYDVYDIEKSHGAVIFEYLSDYSWFWSDEYYNKLKEYVDQFMSKYISTKRGVMINMLKTGKYICPVLFFLIFWISFNCMEEHAIAEKKMDYKITVNKTVKKFKTKGRNKTIKVLYRYDQPVFSGKSRQIKKINRSLQNAYQKDRKNAGVTIFETGKYLAHEGVGSATLYSKNKCVWSYYKDNIVSFCYTCDWYAYGTHNSYHWGATYDLKTGKKLLLTDVVSGSKRQIKLKLWKAFKKQYPEYMAGMKQKTFTKIALSEWKFYLRDGRVTVSSGSYGPFGGNGEMTVDIFAK